MSNSEITLTGRLICETVAQSRIVRAHLPTHIALTRAEPGCLSFEVTQSDDPLIWDVAERFRDADAFHAHQDRVAVSAWGYATRGIPRDYQVTGLSS